MAQVFLFKLAFWLACWSVVGEECDDPSILQAKHNRSHPEKRMSSTPQVLLEGAAATTAPPQVAVEVEVTCGNLGFFDFNFEPGAARTLENEDELVAGSGIILESSLPRNNACGGAAIWNESVNDGDDDLVACTGCQMLIVYTKGATATKINDCAPGPNTITLRLEPPRKVLGYEFWDNEPALLAVEPGYLQLVAFVGLADAVYTHYSGHKSFTKGLLVVDQSGGTMRQMAELTSKDCQWRIKMPGQEWAPVKESELYFVPDGSSFVTGFKVGLETKHLKMSMNTEHGKTNVAGMFVSCRPSHHINLKMHMVREGTGDEKYVKGEMRGFKRRKAANSMLQVNGQMAVKDEEYSVTHSWQELGGSRVAAEYFEAMDEPGQLSGQFLGTCGEADKKDAKKICAKHLGAKMEHATGADADFFSDCVFDVCTGSGEVAAELAAELKMFSGKKDKDD